jgi:hypothetical protein
MLASRVLMSKLIYLMPVWTGCEEYLVNALQIIQNKVARSVTKKDIFNPTQVLMKECGWLTVKQLLQPDTVPENHTAASSNISLQKDNRPARLDLAERSWCWRAAKT